MRRTHTRALAVFLLSLLKLLLPFFDSSLQGLIVQAAVNNPKTHLVHGRLGQIQADGTAQGIGDAVGQLFVHSRGGCGTGKQAAAAAAGGTTAPSVQQLFLGRRFSAALRVQRHAHHIAAAHRRGGRRCGRGRGRGGGAGRGHHLVVAQER